MSNEISKTEPKAALITDKTPSSNPNGDNDGENQTNLTTPSLRKVVLAKEIGKKLVKFSVLPRVIVSLVLLYVVIGSFYFPYWWYAFLFRGGLFSARHWEWGLGYVTENLVWPAIVATILLALGYILSPDGWKTRIKSNFNSASSLAVRKKIRAVEVLLLLLLALSLLTLSSRSARDPARFFDDIEVRRLLAERTKDPAQDDWMRELLGPSSFLYLGKESIDSLYGQYEPDLIPTSVIEELKESNQIKGGVTLESFLTTEAGKEELRRRATEYKQTPKTPERKFKELLQYLLEKKFIRRYGSIQEWSPEVDELDQAINVLNTKYNISVDSKQVLSVRDRLLSQQMERLGNQLRDLKGLALVDGNWIVEKQADAFIFRRAFIENVTEPPICEIRIRKSELSESNRETIERLDGQPISLRIFGNALAGMTEASKVVHLNPIAIFQ
jgi:hypothetical protein